MEYNSVNIMVQILEIPRKIFKLNFEFAGFTKNYTVY